MGAFQLKTLFVPYVFSPFALFLVINYYNMKIRPFNKLISYSVLILAVVTCGAVLVIGRDFIYPICFAIINSYLIFPLVNFFEKKFKYSGLAILASIIIAVIVSIGIFFFLYQQFSAFISDFPQFREQVIVNLKDLQNYISENSSFSFRSDDWLKNQITNLFNAQENFVIQFFSATTATSVALGVQPVYVFFMLYYRHHFRDFLFQITPRRGYRTLRKILYEITSVTNKYVTGLFIVVIILCFLNSIGLMIVGIEYALFFGIISATLNLIPYFGTLIGGSIPLLYTLVSTEPSDAIGVIILFAIVQLLENNILTPYITGAKVAINPLFTIFATILGGLTWGVPGMFLIVPFLGIFKIVCENIPVLQPLSFLLSLKNSDKEKNLII
jgi:predicted PurR-regulated permease PerM